MNFFTNIRDKIKAKTEEMLEKKSFLTMVEDQSKPIRRKAYLEQKKRDAWEEGKAIAKKENEKTLQKVAPVKKIETDFGLKPIKDKWAFLDDLNMNEQKRKGSDLTQQKTNLTKSRKHKK